jgi:hypothetical protein
LKKKRLAVVCLALVALMALVFVVPAAARRAGSEGPEEKVHVSIKPWSFGFWGGSTIEDPNRGCGGFRKVAVYEMTGTAPDPAVDHKVDEGEQKGQDREWSTRGAEPGHKYYAEIPPLDQPKCVGARSEVITAPAAPRPDEAAPRCVHADQYECHFEFHGTLNLAGRSGCAIGPRPGSGGGTCPGEYRRPDGTIGKFIIDENLEWDGRFTFALTAVPKGADPEFVGIEGEIHPTDAAIQPFEAFCPRRVACPTTIYPSRAAPGERGGDLAFKQAGTELDIHGYLYLYR